MIVINRFKKRLTELDENIIDFWLDNNAVSDRKKGLERVDEVACVLMNDSKEIIGLSSLYTKPPPFPGYEGEAYHFRTFVRPDRRGERLSFLMFSHTRDFLRDSLPAGEEVLMLVIFENDTILTEATKKYFSEELQTEFFGTEGRGYEVWGCLVSNQSE